MTIDVLLWSIPPLILLVAMLGVRRYSPLNLARHVGGSVIVLATLAVSTTGSLNSPGVVVLLGAIGGTLVGQAYEDEKRRAVERRRAVGLDDDRGMAVAARG